MASFFTAIAFVLRYLFSNPVLALLSTYSGSAVENLFITLIYQHPFWSLAIGGINRIVYRNATLDCD